MQKTEFVHRVCACERTLYRVARTMLASDADCEDAVQEALLRAWQGLRNLRQEQYFETWLIRILINECKKIWRRGAREIAEVPMDLPDERTPQGEVFSALRGLPEKLRIALELHYVEGYRVREVAELLRLPEGTVKWRLQRGRTLLETLLKEDENERMDEGSISTNAGRIS